MSENNGMITKIWGPPAWIFLHSVTMGYPVKFDPNDLDHVNRRNSMIDFFNSLANVLPCKYCRESYDEYIKESPIESNLSTRVELARWLYDIHNKVNYKLGIPLCDIPEFIEVYDRYEQYRAKCTITDKSTSLEREQNKHKGCVVPHDGIPKKCSIEIMSKDGHKIHHCSQKPMVSHNLLIEFYKGNETVINKKGIHELLNMDIERICSNFNVLYLIFPQVESGPTKVPLLDSEIIQYMKSDILIQANLIRSINKIVRSIDKCTNIISHMLTTIMLIGDPAIAFQIASDLNKEYNTNPEYKKIIDEFSYSNLIDEWNAIVTL